MSADFDIRQDCTMTLLEPVSIEAIAWCADYLPDDCPQWGDAYAIETNKFPPILRGILAAGLSVDEL